MSQLFVSYCSKDRPAVKPIVAELEGSGHEVWWDREIPVGHRFDHTISKELQSADLVVVVWSNDSVESDWVRWEAGEALEEGRLIPIRIDDARLPLEFQRTQTVDLRRFLASEPDLDGELDRLHRAIAARSETVRSVQPVSSADTVSVSFDPKRELADEPSIAVMPFRNQSPDNEYEYFADGISEDLVHALSLWKSFPVVSFASTLPFKNKQYSLEAVTKTLGVRYLVTGQVSRAGTRIRVAAELTDTRTKLQLWRERRTVELADFFELQEDISTWIASHIQPRLLAEARNVAARKKPADMNAWDLGLRAHVEWLKHTEDSNLRARELALRAIEIDPSSVFSRVTLAESYYLEIFYRWTEDVLGSIVKYVEVSSEALELAPDDAATNVQKGMAHVVCQEREQAIEYLSKAVSLNPYSRLARAMLGQMLVLKGNHKNGIEHITEAIRISPNETSIWGDYGALALAYYADQDFIQSIVWAERCTSIRPQFPLAWAIAASSCAAAGEQARAEHFVQQMTQHNPELKKHELLFVLLGGSPELLIRFKRDLEQAGFNLDDPTRTV